MPSWPVVELQGMCSRALLLRVHLLIEGTIVRQSILSVASADSSERWCPMRASVSRCFLAVASNVA
jgi:hypothetical protein